MGRIFAVVGAVGMCVNGQRGELWETVFAGCGKAGRFSIGREYLFSIGGAAVFHISIA